MKKPIIICIVALFMLPVIVKAESYDYTNDDAKIQFTIDESIWEPTDLLEDREYIELKWVDDSCGTFMYGATDVYYELSSEEREEYSRNEYNYTLITESDAEVFAEEMGNYDDYGIRNYKMKFVQIEGSNYYQGISANYHMYMTLNNGYLVQFQYYGSTSKACLNKVIDIVKTTESTIKVNNSVSDAGWFGNLLVSLILTIACYMAYPFIRVKLMKKKYTEETCKKMAIWNSVIVGAIFMVLTIESGGVWSAIPAYIYYSINKTLWISKEKKETKAEEPIHTKETSSKQNITICECGCKVLEQFDKCPKCGKRMEK